ncbi:hypothetical protein V6259_18170 [Marinomonas sp. TI.3.20]
MKGNQDRLHCTIQKVFADQLALSIDPEKIYIIQDHGLDEARE